MKKIISIITIILSILAVGLTLRTHLFYSDVLLSLTITVVVFTYHFAMRLGVGYLVNAIYKNNVNYNAKWFQEKKWEAKCYSFLKVKKWKRYMPTFSPESFDITKRSLDEILRSGAQAEIVHEIIVILSFMPILLAIPFGTIGVFIATSIVSALFDSIFIIMQRFNRPRLIRLKTKKRLFEK